MNILVWCFDYDGRVQRKMKTGNFYRDVNKGISLIIIIT